MIIGFVGQMGSGKTTACNFIKELWGDKVKHINFKDSLIEEMRQTMPLVLEELAFVYDRSVDELFKTKPPVMRALMQNYGTELRRNDNHNYWVEKWQDKVREAVEDGYHVVCDDVRFLNEADAVARFYNSKLILLRRTDLYNERRHQSETEMDQIITDVVITSGLGDEEYVQNEILKALSPY